jgi:hypothetical protein
MFKVDLYKLNTTKYFTGVKLDLLPKEIVFYFINNSFSFFCNEIIDYKYNISQNEDIQIELKVPLGSLHICIKPYKREHYNTICEHLDNYCKDKLEHIINPIYYHS